MSRPRRRPNCPSERRRSAVSPQDVAAVASVARDLTVGSVLLLIIGAWLRGVVKRAADADKELATAQKGHENTIAAHEKAIAELKAAHVETIRQLREGYEALLTQVRAELAASKAREEKWETAALEQRQTMREAVNVANNAGRG
jgi:hypothetical protein